MSRRSPIVPAFVLVGVTLLTTAAAASEVDRLAQLARVWATVKYLHPFMLQKDIDWDEALVRAVPKVRAATTDDELARAVGSMLDELGDRATRVVKTKEPSKPTGEVGLFRRIGDTLVIDAGPYAQAKGGMALWGESASLDQEIRKSKQVVVDVRHHPPNADEAGLVAYVVSELSGLSAEALAAPSSLYVYHSGYRPQQGTTSGGYHSGLLTVAGPTFVPAAGTIAPARVIFVTDGESYVPPLALALSAAGKALIVSNALLGDEALVSAKTVDLGKTWRALVRVEQIADTGVAAHVIAADPLTESLAIMNGKEAALTTRIKTSSDGLANVRWRPDVAYKEMLYPDVGHRLLAAFRIWSIIHYFYPYKALIGDWDAALTDAIPQFVAAANEDEYAMAVLEMVARVEDGHSRAYGHPAVSRILGTSREPIEVREVENEFVVTRVYGGAPVDGDVRVGDIVLSVDGEPFRERVSRLRKYVTASTEVARTNRLAAFALFGPKESPAMLTVRGADQQVRSVRLAQTAAPQPVTSDEPFRILDGNIGYVDLTRLSVPEVDKMFDALKATTAIIFDMRGYPRGTAWSIAPRINTKGAKVGAVFRRAQISEGGLQEAASGYYFEQPLPASESPKYTGRTVMLIDDRAISQAEHTGLFFEAASGITFIGTPTAGANGDVTNFFLPGGFRIGFTGHDVRHADGRQLQRVGIQPHIRVEPTIQGVRAGRDEVLERAVAHLNAR